MLKCSNQKRKLNNKGMTLVEIIVTITILALVSGILLSAFVSVMRTSTKSRDVHRATTVAQNIMEGINLKKAEEMAYQFNYPITKDSAGADVDNFSVYPASMFQYSTGDSVGELFEWTDPVSGDVSTEVVTSSYSLSDYEALADAYDIAGANSAYMSDITSGNYDFLQDENGKYIYYMRNIMNDGRYYNAKITLDASAYKSTGSSGLTTNEDEIIFVPTIDSTYDAVEVMKDDLDLTSLDQMKLNNPGEAKADGSNLCRTIEVTIENALMVGPSEEYRTTIKVDYYYYIQRNDGTFSIPIQTIGTNTVFENAGMEAEKQLRSIYLYYYPLYNSTFSNCKDIIKIKNPNSMDIDVYIIKQEPSSGGMTPQTLASKEQTYGVTLNVEEPDFNAQGKSHIILHTNWDENLAEVYTGMSYTTNQAIYKRNGYLVTEDMFGKTDIKNKKAYDRMFDVKVEIYKSEECSDLSTFKTSIPLSDWFKEENHLITVTSSISQ